ncbi:MAG: hypothetical protein V3W41_06835 [Planctomycetota bacterium]
MIANTLKILQGSLTLSLTIGFLLGAMGAPSLLADEIKLKSGETFSNVKILKQTETTLRVRFSSGKKRTLKLVDVESQVVKPTTADQFAIKAKALGRKDKAGMIALAKWGLENDARPEARKLLSKLLKKNKKDAEIRTLLGHEQGEDGKWRYGKALKKYQTNLKGEQLKAQGWVKIKGEWVTPFIARRLKAKLVEHEGRWIKRETLKKLEAGKIFVEGTWYEKTDRAQLDEGMRREDGKWLAISELNASHRVEGNPWELEMDHYFVSGRISHKNLTRVAKHLEASWQPLMDLFGDGPLAADRGSKINVFIAKSQDEAASICNDKNPDKRQDVYNERTGGVAFADGGAITYWHSLAYAVRWSQHAAAQDYLNRVFGYARLKSPAYEMVGAYFESFVNGKYRPDGDVGTRIGEWKKASLKSALYDFDILVAPASVTAGEDAWAKLGFAMHYLVEKHPEITKAWLRSWAHGNAEVRDLLAQINEKMKDEADRDLQRFAKGFSKNWKAPRF